ncbi:MAG: thiamine phosphate synthase [Desulfobacterales bacterium]
MESADCLRRPVDRFTAARTRIYCFADSLDLCGTLLAAGARLIQLRHKTADDTTFRELAVEMLEIVRRYPDAVLIVNDRVDIALEIGADGVHIGQEDEDCRKVIGRLPPDMIIGVSARFPETARAAESAGATYVGSGAVFATASKPEAVVIGMYGLRAVVAAVKIPVVAIGGITADNVLQTSSCGARFLAVLSDINAHCEPAKAYRRLETLLHRPD